MFSGESGREAAIKIEANDGTKGVLVFPPEFANYTTMEARKKITLQVFRSQGTFGKVAVSYYSRLVSAQANDFDLVDGVTNSYICTTKHSYNVRTATLF